MSLKFKAVTPYLHQGAGFGSDSAVNDPLGETISKMLLGRKLNYRIILVSVQASGLLRTERGDDVVLEVVTAGRCDCRIKNDISHKTRCVDNGSMYLFEVEMSDEPLIIESSTPIGEVEFKLESTPAFVRIQRSGVEITLSVILVSTLLR